MTPLMLQDYLVDETKRLFAGFILKNVKGEDGPLNIYPQRLPSRKKQKDTDHYPFITIMLLDGEDPDEMSPNQCRVLFYCGIYDDTDDLQGYRDCMNIVQHLYEHLARQRIFGGKYQIEYPIKWTTTEEDHYPYYYGGLETIWTIGKVSIHDDDLT